MPDPGFDLTRLLHSESGQVPQPLRQPGQLPHRLANVPVGSLAAHDQPGDDVRDPVTHAEPVLTFGASGESVERLVRLLAYAGSAYATNSIVNGENPHLILDNSVMADVRRFRADHQLAEPKDLFHGRDVAADQIEGAWVGPYTWQKLYELAGV